jgi:hypothetical protein
MTMHMPIRFLAFFLFAFSLSANIVSLTGSLDPTNPEDVFLYSFTVPAYGVTGPINLSFQSFGYGGGTNAAGTVIPSGGFDAYLSVFSGMGDSATFLASNDDGKCPPGPASPVCEDPTLILNGVPVGTYRLALTVFDNISFAENYGSGTLGDGFTSFGDDYYDAASNSVRTWNFAIDVTSNVGFAPEPGSFTLFAAGALIAACWRLSIFFRRKVTC